MIDREVAQQALEALEAVYGDSCDAIYALRAALAEPAAPTPYTEADCLAAEKKWSAPAAPTEPAPGWCKHCRQYTIQEPLQAAPTVVEPVAWRCADGSPSVVFQQYPQALADLGIPIEPLYSAPPRAALTREQAIALWADKSDGPSNSEIVSYCRAIEAAHNIGGPRNE